MALRLKTRPSAEPTAMPAMITNATAPITRSGRPEWARASAARRPAPPARAPAASPSCRSSRAGCRTRIPGCRCPCGWRPPARLHAEAAEDALAEVDVEAGRHLLDVRVRVLVGDDVDAPRRADRLAHHAGHAARRAILAAHEPVQRAQPRRERAPLLGILDGHGAARVTPSERVREMLAHVGEEVMARQHEAGHHLAQVEALRGLHGRVPHASSTAPVSTMFRIESGKSPSQPSRIAWS